MNARARRPPRAPSRPFGGRGITLLEALLACSLLVLVMVPIFTVLEGGTRLFRRGEAAANGRQYLRSSLDLMVRELRMVGFDPSATGIAVFFEAADPTRVRFIADVDGDGVTKRVEYAYSAAARTVTRQFWRWDAAAAAWGPGSNALPIARNVENLTLSYFDATEGAAAALADIRRVTIAMTCSEVVPGHGLERFAVGSEARARNL